MTPRPRSVALFSLFALSASVSAGHHTAHVERATVTAAPASTITPKALAVAAQTTRYGPSYKVNPFAVGRGPQSGYNQVGRTLEPPCSKSSTDKRPRKCNQTTEGPDSQCQTAIITSAADFCLWGSPGLSPNGTIGEVEAAVVAYCTRSGHGARVMPAGTITAVQFMRTPGYIQVVGLLNQTGINLNETDYGGELDPHGADLLGIPIQCYSAFAELTFWSLLRLIRKPPRWIGLLGRVHQIERYLHPDPIPTFSTDLNFCENRYDLIGCNYNAPAAYAPGVFESCDGDVQSEVGTYTVGTQTLTWSQPTLLPATSTLPWTPFVPASSNCVTYQSSDLFPVASLGYQSNSPLIPTAAATTASSGSAASGRSGSGSASSPTKTGSSSTAGSTSSTSKSGSSSISASLFGLAAVGAAAVAML
ncbi:hypothetical protein RQP46_001222 [Phenoliferia psychrophenolica]